MLLFCTLQIVLQKIFTDRTVSIPCWFWTTRMYASFFVCVPPSSQSFRLPNQQCMKMARTNEEQTLFCIFPSLTPFSILPSCLDRREVKGTRQWGSPLGVGVVSNKLGAGTCSLSDSFPHASRIPHKQSGELRSAGLTLNLYVFFFYIFRLFSFFWY